MTRRRGAAGVFAVLVIAIGTVTGAVGVGAAMATQGTGHEVSPTGALTDVDSHAHTVSNTSTSSSTLDWPTSGGTVGRTSASNATGSVTQPVERWRTRNGSSVADAAPVVGDVDGDGSTEVVVVRNHDPAGDGRSGVYVFEGAPGRQTGSVEWTRLTGETFATSPAIGDVDGDGEVEVVVGHGGTLSALDGATGAIEWNFTTARDDIVGDPVIGDVDADGVQEVLAGAGPTVHVVDGTSGIREWPATIEGEHEAITATLGSLDGDGATEVVVGGTSGTMAAFDGATVDVEWLVHFHATSFSSATVYRQNGAPRVAVATSASSRKVRVIDQSGEVAWESVLDSDVDTGTNPFAAADVDDDGATELAVGDSGGVTLFEDGTQEWTTTVSTANDVAVAIADIDGDGETEVLGMGDTQYVALSGTSGEIEWSWSDVPDQPSLGGTPPEASVGDVDDDGDAELVVDNDRVQVLDGEPPAGDGVDRFRNEDGVVDAPGLLDAAAAFRSGEIDADLLLDVAAAFRSGESAA